MHLPRGHGQVETVERAGAPERLDQAAYVDDRVGAAHAGTLLSFQYLLKVRKMMTVTDRSVEQLGAALAEAGMPSLPSRIFAALLIDDDGRMTSAELTEVLGVSAASVSGGVKYLAHLQMLRRERERGSRREVYVVDDDAWHGLMMRRDHLYAPILRALQGAIDDARHRRAGVPPADADRRVPALRRRRDGGHDRPLERPPRAFERRL